MKTYNQFVNESVRDAMKPKSKEEIMNSLDGNPTVKFRRSKKTGTSGTFLIGEIDMNYYDIVNLFGEPDEDEYIGNNFYWVLESSDNHLVTIYDNNSDLEFYELMEEPNYPWHIGGNNKEDYKDLLYYIYDKIL